MIISPCISICKTDPVSGYCYGCARKTEEKINKFKPNKKKKKKNHIFMHPWEAKVLKMR